MLPWANFALGAAGAAAALTGAGGDLGYVGGGPYWLAPAVLLAILAGLGNAWVLLIEILR